MFDITINDDKFDVGIYPSSLTKKFLEEEDPLWIMFAPPWIRQWTNLKHPPPQ